MAINFKEEQVRVEYVIGEDTVRESVTGVVVAPDNKPPIERVLEVTTRILNTEYTVEEGGVLVSGNIEVGVTYVGAPVDVDGDGEPDEYTDQPVHYFHDTVSFDNFIEIPEAEEGMSAYVDVDVIRANYNFNPMTDDRSVEVNVIIRKFAKVLEYRQITIVTDVKGIRQELVEKELLRIENVVAENTAQVIVEGVIEVPEQKPPIERVLRVQGGTIETVSTEVVEDAVIVDGEFEAGVMYVGAPVDVNGDGVADEYTDQPVHFAHDSFTISEVIDVPGAEPGMSEYVDVRVKRWSYNFVEGTKEVQVEALLEFFVKVTEPRQIMVVIDVNSDRVELERELLRVEEVIGENTISETITKQLVVPSNKPNIEKVLEGNAQLFDPSCTVEDGGALIQFNLEGSVIYVAAPTDIDDDGEVEYEDQPVHYFHRTFEGLTNFVEIPDAEEGMSCYSDVNIRKVRATRQGLRTVELSVTLSKFAKVTNFIQLMVVTDLVVVSDVVDKDECERPTKVIYVVQPGDTLYKIARRYRTTVDAIIEANDLENPDFLHVGQKLIIPKCIIDQPKG